jgi:hypothetical protein
VRISDILDDGEHIAVDARRHLSGCAFFVFASVALAGALGYGWSAWHGAPGSVHEAFAYGSGALVLIALGRVVRFRSHHVIVTDDRILFVWGVLRRHLDEVELSEVTGVTREQRFRDRVVVKGSLRVGMRDFDQPLVIRDMARPRRLVAAINAGAASNSQEHLGAPKALGEDARDQLAHLELMHRRGVITADEFAEKRSQLDVSSDGSR